MTQPSVQRAVPSKVIAQRTPALIAIERIAKLATQGVAPHRLAGAAMDILADWRCYDLVADEMRQRIETLQSDIEGGIQAAEDYVAQAESETAKVAAAKQLESLVAVRHVLSSERAKVG
jgi:hypothetical protein